MTKSRRLPYVEGDLFVIEIGDCRYVGRIARSPGNGGILAYLFGPFSAREFDPNELHALRAKDSCLIAIVSDLSMMRGKWLIINKENDWHKEEWPLPEFGHSDLLSGEKFARVYDERTLLQVAERPISKEEFSNLPRDGVMGSDYLEVILPKR